MPTGVDYARAVEDFERLSRLFSLVREAKVLRRRIQVVHRALQAPGHVPRVDRDLTVLSLATKAITTHAAIRRLCDCGFGSDALALGRVLLENVILLEWLLHGGSYRIELFALSTDLHRQRYAEVVAFHYANRPELALQAERRAAKHARALREIFGNTYQKWARRLSPDGSSLERANVSLEGMFHELAQPDSPAAEPPRRSFVGEVVYLEGSWHVHTAAMSLLKIAKRIAHEVYFALGADPGDEPSCVKALRSANLLALAALAAIDRYGALGLDEAIDALHESLKVPAAPDVNENEL